METCCLGVHSIGRRTREWEIWIWMDGEEEAELGNPKTIRRTPKACSDATPPNHGNLPKVLEAN